VISALMLMLIALASRHTTINLASDHAIAH
jgi:hypothetical protein